VVNRSMRRYASSVSEPINLADPSWEPSDAQLAGLMQRAFAGVRPAQAEMLRKLRAEIALARTGALRRLDELEAVRVKS
jgi:hypothetical protein